MKKNQKSKFGRKKKVVGVKVVGNITITVNPYSAMGRGKEKRK